MAHLLSHLIVVSSFFLSYQVGAGGGVDFELLSISLTCVSKPATSTDLKLCSHDVIDYDGLPDEELEVLRLEESTFVQLSQSSKWKPNHLAWPNKPVDTLTSHYGNAVGRGESQLVPSCCPFFPRRFSVRECARIMGFPNNYCFRERRDGQGEMAYRKENYRMIGNAVCPPLIAALAGSVLDAAGIVRPNMSSWTAEGRRVAIDLSRASLRPRRAEVPMGCLVPRINDLSTKS